MFGTGGISHGGQTERIIMIQGGMIQGQRLRKRWELGWTGSGGAVGGIIEGSGIEYS